MLQQGLGLARDTLGNVYRRGLAGQLAHGPVEVVDVHGKLAGKVRRGTQLQPVVGRVDRKLPLQQPLKQGCDAGGSVGVLVIGGLRLQFEGFVDDQVQVVAHHFLLVEVAGVQLLLHLTEKVA